MDRAVKGSLIALALATALGASALVFAGDSQDLGSNLPARPDVSASPQFHVYQWLRNGVTYIQVNDINNNVDFAVATGGGEVLVLPIGHPELVNVAQSASASGQSIYASTAVTISQVAGSFMVVAGTPTTSSAPIATAPTMTTDALCSNPADCSQAVASPTH
ncbi:hypothetical protein [Dyella sp.]|jgi:hypothetical protein|uniref:hypothetical protein n=1 Tax=Dyella sp. TaxID=1869338 RepID=UPI002FDA66D5